MQDIHGFHIQSSLDREQLPAFDCDTSFIARFARCEEESVDHGGEVRGRDAATIQVDELSGGVWVAIWG